MALARLDLPGLVLYNGSIAPGRFRGKDVTIQDVFEAVGAHAVGKMTGEELHELEDVACPARGLRGSVHRQHDVHRARVPGHQSAGLNGSLPSRRPRRRRPSRPGARHGPPPPRRATVGGDHARGLENAIASIAATGGSTNGVLHLLAIARELDIPLDRRLRPDRSPDARRREPQAGGRFVATDVYEAAVSPSSRASL